VRLGDPEYVLEAFAAQKSSTIRHACIQAMKCLHGTDASIDTPHVIVPLAALSNSAGEVDGDTGNYHLRRAVEGRHQGGQACIIAEVEDVGAGVKVNLLLGTVLGLGSKNPFFVDLQRLFS